MMNDKWREDVINKIESMMSPGFKDTDMSISDWAYPGGRVKKPYRVTEETYKIMTGEHLEKEIETMTNDIWTNDDDINESIKTAYELGIPLILLGGAGTGKSTAVMKWVRDRYSDINIFQYTCHSNTESIDLLGSYTRMGEDFVYRDGIVTSAFARAVDDTVCLVLDNIDDMSNRERDVLVGSLSPDNDGMLMLDTGRAIYNNGRAISETITIHKDNLFFIATATGDYRDIGDEAFRERFLITNRDTINGNDVNDMIENGSIVYHVLDKFIDILQNIDYSKFNFRHIHDIDNVLSKCGNDDTSMIEAVLLNIFNSVVDISVTSSDRDECINHIRELSRVVSDGVKKVSELQFFGLSHSEDIHGTTGDSDVDTITDYTPAWEYIKIPTCIPVGKIDSLSITAGTGVQDQFDENDYARSDRIEDKTDINYDGKSKRAYKKGRRNK